MRKLKLSLGTRIYISMMLLLLLSFIIIGGSTAFQFKKQNDEYHAQRSKRKENQVMTNIHYLINNRGTGRMNADSIFRLFDEKICEIADINNIDINVFSLTGELLISSYSNQFDSSVFTFNVRPDVMAQLEDSERVVISIPTQKAKVLSTYTMLRSAAGKPVAIVNIPYFRPNDVNRRELKDFLLTLVEIYIVLFIGASVLAYFLARYITGSLKKIRERLVQTKIENNSDPLEWSSNDEIGMLVNAYNEMVAKLGESAQQLAQSERESAWREMAKQVAHEIKNPLTPMKLSIQHLQRTIDRNDENFEERINRFAATLIEQIDTLSTIATEFSDFAKMPKATNEAVALSEIVENTVDLYSEDEQVEVVFENQLDNSCIVFADRKQLGRIFQNLIKNAIQAVPDDQEGRVEVICSPQQNGYGVAIRDNGTGIAPEMHERIFEPNFTTKTGGMGLGLAMVKGMIENAGGSIHFETQVGKGTTFYVSLPKYEPESAPA